MNSHNMNMFPPLSIKVISMGMTPLTSLAPTNAELAWAQ